MIVLIDGNSNLNLAKAAADTAKSHQILLFAIGIGSVNQNTLTAIASEIPMSKPSSLHKISMPLLEF